MQDKNQIANMLKNLPQEDNLMDNFFSDKNKERQERKKINKDGFIKKEDNEEEGESLSKSSKEPDKKETNQSKEPEKSKANPKEKEDKKLIIKPIADEDEEEESKENIEIKRLKKSLSDSHSWGHSNKIGRASCRERV